MKDKSASMNRQASIQMLGNPVVRKELKEARKYPPIIEPSEIHRIILKNEVEGIDTEIFGNGVTN